jgi:hypothetical protein
MEVKNSEAEVHFAEKASEASAESNVTSVHGQQLRKGGPDGTAQAIFDPRRGAAQMTIFAEFLDRAKNIPADY